MGSPSKKQKGKAREKAYSPIEEEINELDSDDAEDAFEADTMAATRASRVLSEIPPRAGSSSQLPPSPVRGLVNTELDSTESLIESGDLVVFDEKCSLCARINFPCAHRMGRQATKCTRCGSGHCSHHPLPYYTTTIHPGMLRAIDRAETLRQLFRRTGLAEGEVLLTQLVGGLDEVFREMGLPQPSPRFPEPQLNYQQPPVHPGPMVPTAGSSLPAPGSFEPRQIVPSSSLAPPSSLPSADSLISSEPATLPLLPSFADSFPSSSPALPLLSPFANPFSSRFGPSSMLPPSSFDNSGLNTTLFTRFGRTPSFSPSTGGPSTLLDPTHGGNATPVLDHSALPSFSPLLPPPGGLPSGVHLTLPRRGSGSTSASVDTTASLVQGGDSTQVGANAADRIPSHEDTVSEDATGPQISVTRLDGYKLRLSQKFWQG